MLDQASSPSASGSLNDMQATLKQQSYQIKLLTNDNQIKAQQLDIFKDKVREVEEANSIYKKQISNMEEKFRLYEEELKLKAHSSDDKTQKLSHNNQYLYKKNQQLQLQVRELEEKIKSSDRESSRAVTETERLRRRIAEMEDHLEQVREKKKRKVGEIERISASYKNVASENQDLNYTVACLTQENEKLQRIIEENEIQLRKTAGIHQQYQELRSQYENEFAESKALEQSYEMLKQKYDDIYYKYNVLLVNQRNGDTQNNDDDRIGELEDEIKHLDAILSQKEEEILELNDMIKDLEEQLDKKEDSLDNELKKVANLISTLTKEQSTSYNYDRENEGVGMRLLIESVLEQNRELMRSAERLRVSSQDAKELKMIIGRQSEEKESLKQRVEELTEENMRLQKAVNDSINNINMTQQSFEERLNDMINIQRETEDNFHEQLQQKTNEVVYLQELLNEAKEKLWRIQEDRNHTLGFIHNQETEIKEFKNRFFQIAEETNNQKNKLNSVSYVLATLLKVFFNLLAKFESLAQQKAYLSLYFQQYEKIKERLIELQLIPPQISGKNPKSEIYKRFKKAVVTVIAALRLRRLQLKSGGIKYDTFDVRHNLTNYPESLKRLFIDLFRSTKFVIQKELVDAVGDIVNNADTQSEDAIVGKLITAAKRFNEIKYEPDTVSSKRSAKDFHIEDLTKTLRARGDLSTQIREMDGKLQSAEDYIIKKEEKFSVELNTLNEKLKQAKAETENNRKEKERALSDYKMAKEQIDALLTIIDEKQLAIPDSERRNRNLNEDFNILHNYVLSVVKRYEAARKELEEKDLRIIDLERQVIQVGNSDYNSVQSGFNMNITREKGGLKVPGKIISSGRKKEM